MQKAFIIHCLSPLHPGTGQAVDLIDLPIARYKATGIPFLPGSSIKGVLRDQRTPVGPRPNTRAALDQDAQWSAFLAAFGPDVTEDDASEHAGAVAFGDGRLLALPVRSLRGTFAYVTSPLLLRFACQDLAEAAHGVPDVPDVPAPDERGEARQTPRVLVPRADSCLLHRSNGNGTVKRVFLEDIDLIAAEHPLAAAWAEWLARKVFSKRENDLVSRFAVVDDDVMAFLWETATQVDAHNRINDRGTVADGQLWYEENLPPETLLLGVATATISRREKVAQDEAAMLAVAMPPRVDYLQFGGKATTGKGRARLLAIT